jgi:large subunit ribosomal protein L9
MPKVDVILTQNVVGLGAESDQVKVAAGYARNFLLPQRLAIPVTSVNKRRLEALRQRRAEREAHELNTMTELSKTLSKLTLVITVKAGEGDKIFGSVTAGSIADELKHQFDVSLDKRKIHLEKALRNVGDHDVELRLHPEVSTTLKVHIKSSNPQIDADAQAAAVAAAAETTAKSEKRDKEGKKAEKGEVKSEKKAEAKKVDSKKEKA